jgi:uncharacterized protein (TIGR03435 family)
MLAASAASQPRFDVASVRSNPNPVGPDYNNQILYTSAGFSGNNVTLRRLIAEAYGLQLNQIMGSGWLDQNEYDVEAQPSGSRDQIVSMLRNLLAERFGLRQHRETRTMRTYHLVSDRGGAKIQPAKDGATPPARTGFQFHGDMRQLADLIAVQLTIGEPPPDPTRPAIAAGPPAPVLNKTNLEGIFDVPVAIRPERGVGAFTTWQRFLPDELGLKLESRRGDVPVLVVDSASREPGSN